MKVEIDENNNVYTVIPLGAKPIFKHPVIFDMPEELYARYVTNNAESDDIQRQINVIYQEK
jgi:hypothetical protein